MYTTASDWLSPPGIGLLLSCAPPPLVRSASITDIPFLSFADHTPRTSYKPSVGYSTSHARTDEAVDMLYRVYMPRCRWLSKSVLSRHQHPLFVRVRFYPTLSRFFFPTFCRPTTFSSLLLCLCRTQRFYSSRACSSPGRQSTTFFCTPYAGFPGLCTQPHLNGRGSGIRREGPRLPGSLNFTGSTAMSSALRQIISLTPMPRLGGTFTATRPLLDAVTCPRTCDSTLNP